MQRRYAVARFSTLFYLRTVTETCSILITWETLKWTTKSCELSQKIIILLKLNSTEHFKLQNQSRSNILLSKIWWPEQLSWCWITTKSSEATKTLVLKRGHQTKPNCHLNQPMKVCSLLGFYTYSWYIHVLYK